MKLAAPFTGPVFDVMYDPAVDVVTSKLLTAFSQITGNELGALRSNVDAVMSALIQAVGLDQPPQAPYNFTPGANNGALLSRVVQLSGVDPNLTETIVSEIYTDDAGGLIPHWFGNIAQIVAQSKTAKQTWQALQPSFLQRVAGTIVAPLGISGAQAILLAEILIGLVALIAIAYVWRSFR